MSEDTREAKDESVQNVIGANLHSVPAVKQADASLLLVEQIKAKAEAER